MFHVSCPGPVAVTSVAVVKRTILVAQENDKTMYSMLFLFLAVPVRAGHFPEAGCGSLGKQGVRVCSSSYVSREDSRSRVCHRIG